MGMEAEPAAAGVHRVAATALLCLLAAPRHVHSGEDHQSRGGQDEGSWAADDRRHKENVEVRIEVHSDPSVRSVAIVEGAEAHERCNGWFEPQRRRSTPAPALFLMEDEDLAIYRWHDHYWIIGAIDHSEDADEKAHSAPVGALYMARAGDPPTKMPPVTGWWDGSNYAATRTTIEARFYHYIQIFAISMVASLLLCGCSVQRKATRYEDRQRELRAIHIENLAMHRAGQRATRERDLVDAQVAEARWESSWMRPFRRAGEDVPRLVQVIHPGEDSKYELGVVVVEERKMVEDGEETELPPAEKGGGTPQDSAAGGSLIRAERPHPLVSLAQSNDDVESGGGSENPLHGDGKDNDGNISEV